jgi:hypothetical protein
MPNKINNNNNNNKTMQKKMDEPYKQYVTEDPYKHKVSVNFTANENNILSNNHMTYTPF